MQVKINVVVRLQGLLVIVCAVCTHQPTAKRALIFTLNYTLQQQIVNFLVRDATGCLLLELSRI